MKKEDKKKEIKEEELENTEPKKEEEAPEKDSATEKVEGFLDDLDYALFGPEMNVKDGIPATYKTDSGTRRVIKHRTNANIQRKLFGHKWVYIGFLVVLAIVGLVFLIRYIINAALLA